ncbi:170_t:CDS:2, partial [Entrophospora sp. SA101]
MPDNAKCGLWQTEHSTPIIWRLLFLHVFLHIYCLCTVEPRYNGHIGLASMSNLVITDILVWPQ